MMPIWDMHSAVDQIDRCEFECEGGALANNAAWRWLKDHIKSGPRYAMGQQVEIDVAADVNGVRLAQACRFTVVAILMDSSTDGLLWKYNLSNDPPSAYHFGKTNFSGIYEDKLRLPAAPAKAEQS